MHGIVGTPYRDAERAQQMEWFLTLKQGTDASIGLSAFSCVQKMNAVGPIEPQECGQDCRPAYGWLASVRECMQYHTDLQIAVSCGQDALATVRPADVFASSNHGSSSDDQERPNICKAYSSRQVRPNMTPLVFAHLASAGAKLVPILYT